MKHTKQLTGIRYTRIINTEHQLFGSAWKLYKKSFLAEERRQLRTQKKIMGNLSYHFELVTEKESLLGFILWWEFDDIRYVEHLATRPQLRGNGYGTHILEDFISRSDVPILLEVEHPVDEISCRRVDFYERAGFIACVQAYEHPPYKKGGEYVPLMLMTWPDTIAESEVRRFCERCHPVIFANSIPNKDSVE